jgi:aspartyl protease family protein
MRQVVYAFIFMAVAGLILVRQMEKSKPAGGDGANAMAMATKKPGSPPPASSSNNNYRSVTLLSDRLGHFQTNLQVDGRAIDFLVDTGASSVALRESDAARLGIHPSARDYNVMMQTANGIGKAARVRLNRVELKGITIYDVQAVVVPDAALSTNLLGMSFLSRVKWTHEHGKLVLEQ